MTVHLPPGPRGVGAFAALAQVARGELTTLFAALSRRYGPVSSLRIGPQRIVFVDDAALVEEILVSRQHEFLRDVGAMLLRELVGDGLLTTDDPAHLERRRLMQPAFHRTHVARYTSQIVTEAERVADGWRDAETVDVGIAMTSLTLGAVGAALFGVDTRGSAGRVADVLARVVQRGRSLGLLLAFGAPLLARLRGAGRDGPGTLFPREREELERIVAPILAARGAGARPQDERDGGRELLSLLREARDDQGRALDDVALRNELVMLVLAGHETTSNALTWALWSLALHPAVERALHAELDEVLGDCAPTAADLPALPYTANVFAETLRLFPPAAAFARRPLAPSVLGGFDVPRGASIYVSPFVTQRNPRYFDAPERFWPERWNGPAPPRFAYFPFGGGSKMCIGEPFARLEGVLALATLARRYALRATDVRPVVPLTAALMRPARPVILRPVPRTRPGSRAYRFARSRFAS